MGGAWGASHRAVSVVDTAVGRSWSELRSYVSGRGGRGVVRELADEFRANDLLTSASAVSFQLVFALVPTLLAAVAVLGFLDLASVWEETVAPELRERLSPAAFEVVGQTVEQVLQSRRGYWLSLGLAFALWQLSGAARATMGALNRIYGRTDERGFLERLGLSFVLAGAFAAGIAVVVVLVQVVPRLGSGAVELAARAGGWAGAFLVLVALVGILLRVGPAAKETFAWLGVVTMGVVLAWLIASALFAAWAARIVSYGSIYGSFAVLILLLSYVYLLALVLLTGVQLDALARTHARGDKGGR